MNSNSINQNLTLPNFRNSGIMLRILAILLKSGSWQGLLREWAGISVVSQPLPKNAAYPGIEPENRDHRQCFSDPHLLPDIQETNQRV